MPNLTPTDNPAPLIRVSGRVDYTKSPASIGGETSKSRQFFNGLINRRGEKP